MSVIEDGVRALLIKPVSRTQSKCYLVVIDGQAKKLERTVFAKKSRKLTRDNKLVFGGDEKFKRRVNSPAPSQRHASSSGGLSPRVLKSEARGGKKNTM